MKKVLLNLLLSCVFMGMYAQNFTISTDYDCFVGTNVSTAYNSNMGSAKRIYIPADELINKLVFRFNLYNNTGSSTVLRYSISYGGSVISTSGFDRKTYVSGANQIIIDEYLESSAIPLTASAVGAKKYITLDLYDNNTNRIQTINLLEVNVEQAYQGTTSDCRYFIRDGLYASGDVACKPWVEAAHTLTDPFTLKILGPKFTPSNNYYNIRYIWEVSTDGINYSAIVGQTSDDLQYYVANPCQTFYVRRTDQLYDKLTTQVLQIAIRQPLKMFTGLNGKIDPNYNKINVNFTTPVTTNPTYTYNSVDGDQLVRIPCTTPVANKLCTNPNLTTATTIQWEYWDPYFPTWQVLIGQTGVELYGNFNFVDGSKIRRKVSSISDSHYSNEVTIIRKNCFTPSTNLTDANNSICLAQKAYYNLYTGAVVNLGTIVATSIVPNISTREYAYEWYYSTDGVNWTLVSGKRLTDSDRAATNRDYTPASITFDIAKGEVQKVYFRRDYFHYYDKWNCGFTNIQPCGQDYHFQNSSNILTIYLSAYPQPKPVPVDFLEPAKTLTCAPADQIVMLTSANLNQWGTQYAWTYPSSWLALTPTSGSYVNSTSYHTQSVHSNAVNGGKVCVTVTQTDISRTVCRDFAGTLPLTVGLPPVQGGCAGEVMQLVPVIGNRDANTLSYTWTLSNPQLANTSCLSKATDNTCKSLNYTPKNVALGNTQTLSLNVVDVKACSLTVQTTITSTAGWFFGTLSYQDPIAIQGSDLVLDNSKNELYYVNTSNRIQKAYYGEDPTNTNVVNSYWQFQEVGGNSVQSAKSVALYRNVNTYRLFYILSGKLKYIESLDRGITWSQSGTLVGILDYLDKIRSYGGYIYVVQSSNRYVYRIDGGNPTVAPLQVSNEPLNYADFTFTVDGGLVAYTNTSNKFVLFNATASNVSLLDPVVNITDLKWNSDLRIYNNMVWMVRNDGKLYTLSKNTSTNKYDLLASVNYSSYVTTYNIAPSLEGKFCINTGSGVIYAKDQGNAAGSDHLFQIANKNGGWSLLELSGTGYSQTDIGYSFVYGFGHAYYIGGDGRVGNSFYLEPCRPDVLRKDLTEEASEVHSTEKFTYTAVDYDLAVAPNPTKDMVQVSYHLPEAAEVGFMLTDMMGHEEVLPQHSQSMAGDFTWSLDLNDQAQGMYMLHILVDGQKVAQQKVIKQ